MDKILAIVLLLATPVWAQTTITTTVGATGRDYSTLQAWEDGEDGDLVSADQVHLGECYNDAAFTTGVQFAGSTTDATRYMHLSVATGERHDGTRYSTAGVRLEITSAFGFGVALDDNYSRVSWLQIQVDASGALGSSNGGGSGTGQVMDKLIVFSDTNFGATEYGIFVNISSSLVKNCLAHGPFDVAIRGNFDARVYNCTAYGAVIGIEGGNDNVDVRNTIALENTTTDFSGNFSAGANHNEDSDASAPGANSINNAVAADEFVSVTGGSENFHLKSGASAIDAASTLAAVTDDIDGDARPQNTVYEIGADEFVAAQAPTAASKPKLAPRWW